MPLFTAQNFVNAIGGTDKITEVCIDKGGNFLAGKVTSVFQKASTTDTQTWTVKTNDDGKISESLLIQFELTCPLYHNQT